jgi:ribosomal protein S18 acetylase RimI-like enzyme
VRAPVRAARERDLDRLAALASLLFAQHQAAGARFALAPGREGELRGLLTGFVRDPARTLLVAEGDAGNLDGFVLASLLRRAGPFLESERGEIDWLFVREEARRRGAGGRLAAAALAWLRERGAGRVEVHVQRDNPGGRAFWDAQGFAPAMDVLERHL